MSTHQVGQAAEDQRMEVDIIARIAPRLMTRAPDTANYLEKTVDQFSQPPVCRVTMKP